MGSFSYLRSIPLSSEVFQPLAADQDLFDDRPMLHVSARCSTADAYIVTDGKPGETAPQCCDFADEANHAPATFCVLPLPDPAPAISSASHPEVSLNLYM